MSKNQKTNQTIRELISKNKIEKAIKLLRTKFTGSQELNEVDVLSAQFQALKRKERLGTIGTSEASVSQNKIVSGLLELVNIEPELEEVSEISPTASGQANDLSANQNTPSMPSVEETKSPIFPTLAVAFLGIVIGFLGELMPDNFKTSVESFATESTGLSFQAVWIICVLAVVILTLAFVWREALGGVNSRGGSSGNSQGDNWKVKQTGDKSVFINKNDGNITIN